MRTVSCNLCGSNDTSVVEKAEPPYLVGKCVSCGLVYTNPQPEVGDIEQHYDEQYYREWLLNPAPGRLPMWRGRMRELMRYQKSGRLLDVGCGPGTFLKVAKEAGFTVEGTELSPFAVKHVRETLAIPVFQGTLEESGLKEGSFDVITFWHSLEHVYDPLANLRTARRLLKPGGLLVLACPNVDNIISRVLYWMSCGKRLRLFSTRTKELHLWHFSHVTFKSIVEKAGFSIREIKPDLAQIVFKKRIIDWVTVLVWFFIRKNYGEALKLYAVKP